jgi:hypothetical protein
VLVAPYSRPGGGTLYEAAGQLVRTEDVDVDVEKGWRHSGLQTISQ